MFRTIANTYFGQISLPNSKCVSLILALLSRFAAAIQKSSFSVFRFNEFLPRPPVTVFIARSLSEEKEEVRIFLSKNDGIIFEKYLKRSHAFVSLIQKISNVCPKLKMSKIFGH